MTHEHDLIFGPFRFETTVARLWRGAQLVPLRPRTRAVLQYLARHPRRVVTKTELLEHVWAGMHVVDTVLRVCIREIRMALADTVDAPQYLQTVGRQGYQWLVAGDGDTVPLAWEGRVEHLTSGQVLRFHASEELLAFLARVLTEGQEPPCRT